MGTWALPVEPGYEPLADWQHAIPYLGRLGRYLASIDECDVTRPAANRPRFAAVDGVDTARVLRVMALCRMQKRVAGDGRVWRLDKATDSSEAPQPSRRGVGALARFLGSANIFQHGRLSRVKTRLAYHVPGATLPCPAQPRRFVGSPSQCWAVQLASRAVQLFATAYINHLGTYLVVSR